MIEVSVEDAETELVCNRLIIHEKTIWWPWNSPTSPTPGQSSDTT